MFVGKLIVVENDDGQQELAIVSPDGVRGVEAAVEDDGTVHVYLSGYASQPVNTTN